MVKARLGCGLSWHLLLMLLYARTAVERLKLMQGICAVMLSCWNWKKQEGERRISDASLFFHVFPGFSPLDLIGVAAVVVGSACTRFLTCERMDG